jgi:hypothetical protein
MAQAVRVEMDTGLAAPAAAAIIRTLEKGERRWDNN